jgi:hypothetical protein
MRSFILAGLGLGVIVGLAVLATTWHSGLPWDIAISIHPIGKPEMVMYLGGVLAVAVALIWRWASSRRA